VKKSIREVMVETSSELPSVDTQLLLGFALHKSREFLFTYPEWEIPPPMLNRWERIKQRRLGGEPAAYITGSKEFYGLPFRVNASTLIPRPESELLVEEVIMRGPRGILDIGTGSGCIAIAVAYHLEHSSVMAVDISRRALRVARKNSRQLLGTERVTFKRSNYFKALGPIRFDVIVSNPPYIKTPFFKYLGKEVTEYEPRLALDAGEDGMEAYRVIMGEGREFLSSDGSLILEISPELTAPVQGLARHCGYRIEKLARDLSRNERMIVLNVC
jgi:release factor glutamine methyltransferase